MQVQGDRLTSSRRGDLEERKVRVRLFISGIVQGVFYRAETRGMALRLGVKGWVRNLP
ncbi:MAG: acylphosphatase, partial [Candidatus Bathyarchaeia archaeon]